MNGAKQFDRWAAVVLAVALGAVAVYGMRIGNPLITHFGELGFAQFTGVLIVLFNRELLGNGNGNGGNSNKESSGTPDPTH